MKKVAVELNLVEILVNKSLGNWNEKKTLYKHELKLLVMELES